MSFNFNWSPQRIPTKLKGQVNLPEIEQPFDFNSYFTNLVNREEMDGYHPAQNFSVPNQQHGGNQAVNYNGYSPTTPMTEQDIINQNMAERQTGNANDMANWIQQGGTPQADAIAAAQAQAEQDAAAKKQQIADIESEIKEIEKRIATNTAKLQNFSGNADKIAAIETRKINRQDPTSIWRWKAGMDFQKQSRKEDLARVEAEKQKTKDEQKLHVQNKLDSYLPTMAVGLNTSPEQAQQFLNTLAGLETEASNYGINDPRIAEMKAKLSGDLPYNQMMAAIDELEDIDANFGKGPDYDRMNAAQKFKVYQKKLEDARKQIIDNNPELWDMMLRDRRYNKKLTTLMSNRRPKSKGTAPARPSTRN